MQTIKLTNERSRLQKKKRKKRKKQGGKITKKQRNGRTKAIEISPRSDNDDMDADIAPDKIMKRL